MGLFPVIHHLDEVVDAIKAHVVETNRVDFKNEFNSEFVVTRKYTPTGYPYDVVNYLVSFADSFPVPDSDDEMVNRQRRILRECRGFTFDGKTGKPIQRKYHKFFNINEPGRPDSAAEYVDLTKPHYSLEKLDGSMVSPMYLDGGLYWTTKMGITDLSDVFEEYVKAHPQYRDLAIFLAERGQTGIFEFMSLKNMIVIRHPQDRMPLTAVRDTITGDYMPYEEMVELANQFSIEPVSALKISMSNVNEFIAHMKALTDTEGVVIRYPNGLMYKCKTDDYCMKHKVKDDLSKEKDILQIILDERVDDVTAMMANDPGVNGLIKFNEDFQNAVRHKANDLCESGIFAYLEILEHLEGIGVKADRKNVKTFLHGEYLSRYPSLERALISRVVENIHQYGEVNLEMTVKDVMGLIRRYSFSGPKIDLIRDFFLGLRWDDYFTASYQKTKEEDGGVPPSF